MKQLILIFLMVISTFAFSAELDPEKNGANELMQKAMQILPESKRENVNLAFLTDEIKGKEAAQQIYEMLETGKFKGVLVIGGKDRQLTDMLVRTVTHYLTQSLNGVTLVIAGTQTTEEDVASKLKALGCDVYFIR